MIVDKPDEPPREFKASDIPAMTPEEKKAFQEYQNALWTAGWSQARCCKC
jgi:hypothetical protein